MTLKFRTKNDQRVAVINLGKQRIEVRELSPECYHAKITYTNGRSMHREFASRVSVEQFVEDLRACV